MGAQKDFGFVVRAGRLIDLDKVVTAPVQAVREAVPEWDACLNCGACTATCAAGINARQERYRLRFAESGDATSAAGFEALLSCFLCGKCQLICPRGIPIRYLSIQILKKFREHAENIPSV